MAPPITMNNTKLAARGILGLLPAEMRNDIYTGFLSNPKGVFIELDSSGIYAKGTDKDRLALTASSKQVYREVSTLMDLATTFELKPPYKTTPEGNQILRNPFDLEVWLNAREPYHFSNAQHVILHIGRLSVSHLGFPAEVAHWETVENSIPLDSPSFLKNEVELSICLDVECPTGKDDLQLRIPMNDIKESIRTVEAAMKARRGELKSHTMDGWQHLSPRKVHEHRCVIWQQMNMSEHRVVAFLETLAHTVQDVRDQWALWKSVGMIKRRSMAPFGEYMKRYAGRV